MIANQQFVDELTVEERIILFSNLEHLPGSCALLPWYQFRETNEVLAVNAAVSKRIGQNIGGTMATQEVLLCKCGACAHWEILHKDGENFIFCMTCKREFNVTLHVPHSEHLEWVGIETKRKQWAAHHEQNA